MIDPHFPSVDLDYLEEQIMATGRVVENSRRQFGSTVSFTLEGNKPIHKRLILIRHLGNEQINFEQATTIAIRLSFLGNLVKWLIENRDYKDGGYFVNPLAN